jgi:hypothetical protein
VSRWITTERGLPSDPSYDVRSMAQAAGSYPGREIRAIDQDGRLVGVPAGRGVATARTYLVGSKSPSLYFSITGRYASHHFASPALSTVSCSSRPRASV